MPTSDSSSAAPPRPAGRVRRLSQHIQRNMAAGVLTLIPIVVTYVVFMFVLRVLSNLGEPLLTAIAGVLQRFFPELEVRDPFVLKTISVLIVIFGTYGMGLIASRVVGLRLIEMFDNLITRIPLVRQVYGSVKSLLNVLRQKPDTVQRVVMIEFPHSEMKTIGLVTRTMRDEATGRELAAVFVPTTPNPTGGYLEVVPVDRLVSTDWSLDEAMNFVISGGAIAPDRIAFSQSSPLKRDAENTSPPPVARA